MPLRPLLDLNSITLDPKLVARIPYRMALYYLALPLACEEYQISVAMAHPENLTGLGRLREVLGMDVVPVRSAPGTIRSALQRWQPPLPATAAKVLAWESGPGLSAQAMEWAKLFGAAFSAEVACLTGVDADWRSAVELASREQCALTIVHRPEAAEKELLSHSVTPVVFVGDAIRPLRRILVVLRGFSSDEYALDWITPLVRTTGASVTLLPLALSAENHLHQMLNGEAPFWQHVGACLQRLSLNSVYPHLKLREGRGAQQIVAEMDEGNYDLVVIPAEGHGEFVGSVLNAVPHHSHSDQCPVLVMKPAWTNWSEKNEQSNL